jgi:hypothetical protein
MSYNSTNLHGINDLKKDFKAQAKGSTLKHKITQTTSTKKVISMMNPNAI